MSEKDIAEKSLLAYNDVFADIVNAFIFGGECKVKESDLTDAQTDSIYKPFDSIKSQTRDVAKFWNKGKIHIGCIGFENQTKIDKDMVLRVMNYDAAVYRSQLDGKKEDEKQDKHFPVVTLVLYFGTEQKWEKNKSLLERLEIPDEKMLPFVNDFKINVFNLAWLSDEEIALFKSDFRDVLGYLRAARLKQTYAGSKNEIAHIAAILDLFKALSGNNKFDEIKANVLSSVKAKGGIKMFDVLQANINSGISRGITLGRSEGIDSMANLFASLFAQGRDEDAKRAATDKAYLQQLLSEQE